MSGKGIMNKFVIRNIVRMMVNCSYVCVFYLMLLSLLDTAGVGANKLPEEDISMVTEVNNADVGSSGAPTDEKSGGFFSSDVGFVHAFIASFSVIIVSELGDKTFFIAAIMAMRHPRLTVFIGAIGALALMTVLSAVFGMAATIIPRVYTYYISTALFALFGLKMLKDGYYMSPTEAAEELEVVQSDLRKREDELMRSMNGNRKETVELVPLNDHDSSKALSSPDRTVGGSTMNGSLHSLVSKGHHHDLPAAKTHHLPTIRMSASASQLQASNHHLPSHHHHHLSDSSSSSINRSKHGSSKSLTVTLGEQTEQRQRTRSGIVANGGINATGAGTGANGTIATGLADGNDTTVVGSTGSINQSKRMERETSATVVQDAETGVIRKNKQRSAWNLLLRILMQAFTMTFLAEWGDRSQLTTIILSARENVYGVIIGGIIGHAICTGLAVIGGRMIAQKISVRTVTIIGGVVFLVFAVSALFFSPEEEPIKVSP